MTMPYKVRLAATPVTDGKHWLVYSDQPFVQSFYIRDTVDRKHPVRLDGLQPDMMPCTKLQGALAEAEIWPQPLTVWPTHMVLQTTESLSVNAFWARSLGVFAGHFGCTKEEIITVKRDTPFMPFKAFCKVLYWPQEPQLAYYPGFTFGEFALERVGRQNLGSIGIMPKGAHYRQLFETLDGLGSHVAWKITPERLVLTIGGMLAWQEAGLKGTALRKARKAEHSRVLGVGQDALTRFALASGYRSPDYRVRSAQR